MRFKSNASSRSALPSEHDSRSSSTKPNKPEAIVTELHLAVESEKQKSAAQLIELMSVRVTLTKEKQKVKRMW